MKKKQRAGMPNGSESELVFTAPNYQVAQLLFGERDNHLRIIERDLDIDVGHNGDSVVLRGQDAQVALAGDLLQQLSDLIERGDTLFQGDVERSIKMLASNRKLRLDEIFRDQVKIAGRKYNIVPKTLKQKEYLESIRAHDIVFGIGPAGTGKTYLAMAMAVAALTNKEVKRIVLCRPAVEAGEKLGFLPGDMAEKVNPYLRPLYDALHDMVEYDRAQEMVEKGLVEVAPLAFMRGRTLSNAFVILDEAQNTTPVQMKMFLTRIGHHSKCVITGDPTQIDLPRGMVSGLSDALTVLRNVDDLAFIYFTENDVLRHPLVSRIVLAYDDRDTRMEG